jgi:twitching motility protein PilT
MALDYKLELIDLISTVIKEGGSDIHFSVGSHPIVRISGDLIPLTRKPELTADDTVGFIRELLDDQKLKRFLDTQEIDFSYEYQDTRLRGNAFFQKGVVSIVMRLVPKIKTLTELNLPPILATFAEKRQGFFLVVGPVGHGKSTTLAALISLINQNRREHIVTVEDPIEYVYVKDKSIIDQREVGLDTKDFQSALKSVFREDVDVILIGEMRNAETIATAVTAAETGHLVFSTLHTNSASQTVDRIIDAFPGDQQDQIRTQLAGSLLGIFSQRLVPRISGGLIPAYELLINNNAVANLIRERRTNEINLVIETGTEQGMIDLNRSLVDLVRRGEITVESAFSYSTDPHALERLLQ